MSSTNGGTVTSPKPSLNPDPILGCTNFETFHQSVCTKLKNRGEAHTLTKTFSQAVNDEERMRFVIEQDFTWGLYLEPFNYLKKNKAESHRLRTLGNQVYHKNKLNEALEFYSQSILFAPHQPSSDLFVLPDFHEQQSEDVISHEELALGYANRSAVLFQMKEYELCIRDITRAFDNSYPNNLMYKLFERKARCLKALKQYPRALEAMKSSEMWMRHSNLSETRSSTFRKEISKQVEFLEEKVSSMSISEFPDSNDHRKSMMTPLKPLHTPEMSQEASKELPCVRNDVKLEYNEKRGRYLVAAQDISAGEVIATETPYASILLTEFYSTHCQFCYRRAIAPIPCCCCARVRFCSDECRVEAWNRFHKVECSQLDLITEPSIGKMGMLAMRILTSSGKIYLDYIIGKVAEEKEARKTKDPNEAERLQGFNEDSVYDAADYRTVYTLVSNTKQRGANDLFKRALMAAYLLKVLQKTPFFYNGGSDPLNVGLTARVAMGAVLLKHLQNLPCNAHELSEMELATSGGSSSSLHSSSRDAVVHEIGAAVFGTLSLFNHSCDPNVVRHYYSSSAAVRTIRPIKKGDEILDNYGYHYAVMSKGDRQKSLSGQYFFTCQCTACQENWPMYPKIPTSLEVLTGVDEKGATGEQHKLVKNYKKAFENVLQGSYSDALPVLLEYLNFLDMKFKRPVRDYNDCQEAIKQCYSAMANTHFQRVSKKDN